MSLRPARLLQVELGAMLAGCQERIPLPDVPIVGGTAEQREQAREELVAFDEWVGKGRVHVSELRFDSPHPHREGPLDATRDRIWIDEDLDPLLVRAMVRHELCHVVDYGERLLDDPEPVLDEAGAILFGPGGRTEPVGMGPRGRRGEALAVACELGPFGAHARSIVCDGESELAAEVARWTVRHVWVGFEPFPPVPRDADPLIITADPMADEREWYSFDLDPSTIPDRISLQLFYGGKRPSSAYTYVSLYTGEGVGWADPADPTWARPPDPPGAGRLWGTGVSTGVGAAYTRFPIPFLGDASLRLLRTDGVDWALADPTCRSPDRHEEIFAADDRLWFAWDDDGWVRWREMR